MMIKQIFTAVLLASSFVCACSSPANTDTTTAAQTTEAPETSNEETTAKAEETETTAAGTTEERAGKGQGFGGTITAHVTTVDGTVTKVVLEGPDETPGIGGAALEELEEQFAKAGGADIDGVTGATVTSNGAVAAVLNALDPEANPYEEPKEESFRSS